jgi:hypothetical protein
VGLVHARARLNPRVIFGPRGCCIPREAVGERDETLHAKEIYVRPRNSYGKVAKGSKRRICLVELIDANRKKTVTGKGWQSVGRTLIGGTHHCTFLAAICTLRQRQCQSSQLRSTRCAGSRRHRLRDAAQVVVAMVRSRVARRYTHTVNLRRDAEQGREVTRRLRADIRRVKTRALGALHRRLPRHRNAARHRA